MTKWMNNPDIKTKVFKFPEQLNFVEASGKVWARMSNDFMNSNQVYSL